MKKHENKTRKINKLFNKLVDKIADAFIKRVEKTILIHDKEYIRICHECMNMLEAILECRKDKEWDLECLDEKYNAVLTILYEHRKKIITVTG